MGLADESCIFQNHLPNSQQLILSQPSLSQHEVRNLRSPWCFSAFQLRYSRRSAPKLWLRPDAHSPPTTMSCELVPLCYIAPPETCCTPSLGPSPAALPTYHSERLTTIPCITNLALSPPNSTAASKNSATAPSAPLTATPRSEIASRRPAKARRTETIPVSILSSSPHGGYVPTSALQNHKHTDFSLYRRGCRCRCLLQFHLP